MKPLLLCAFFAAPVGALPAGAAPSTVYVPYDTTFSSSRVFSLDEGWNRPMGSSLVDRLRARFPAGVGINRQQVTSVYLMPRERRSDRSYTLRSPLFFELEGPPMSYDGTPRLIYGEGQGADE